LIAPIDSEHRHESSCGETLLGEFYDQPIRLTLVGYLRPELPFEGLEKLVAAIKQGELSDESNFH
jgi:FAD synthase